jgi:tetratricopeptide (TPR) repeat protein
LKKALNSYELYIKAAEENGEISAPFYNKAKKSVIELLSKMGRNHKNIDKYKSLLRENPDDVMMYVHLTLAFKLARQYDDAMETIAAGLKLQNNQFMLLWYAGEICKALARYDDAFAYWNKAKPEFVNCLFSTACLYQELGQTEDAIRAWEKVVAFFEERGYVNELVYPKEQLALLLK